MRSAQSSTCSKLRFIYAMMRMYEGYASEAECLVCRNTDEALAWLLNRSTTDEFDD